MLFGENIFDKVQSQNIPTSASQIIAEHVLTDILSNEEVLEMCSSAEDRRFLVDETEICTEKTIVRLDKKAKISRAFKAAVFTVAREKKDPKFKKLLTIWRIERTLEAYLTKKYHNEAMKRARMTVSKMAQSGNGSVKKTKVVAKAVEKAKKQMNAR